jgi:mannosyltransferase
METSALPAPAAEEAKAAGRSAGFPRIPAACVVLLLTAAAAVVRLHALAGRGFWLDETISASIAGNSLSAIFRIIREREIYMALYYVFLHFWALLGDSEFVLRLPSVIFSVATIPFTYALGARLFGRIPGVIAAALLTFNAFHIRFAQEARSYALVILLAALSSWLLARNVQQPHKASWTLYGVLLALMISSHLFAVLIVAAHGAALACLPPSKVPWKGLGRSALWFVVLVLPLAAAVLNILSKTNPLDWAAPAGFSNTRGFFEVIAGNRGMLLVVLDGIAVAALIFKAARMQIRKGRSEEGWPAIFVLAWFFVPVGIALAVAEFSPPFVPRYLLPCLPAFLICVGAGLTEIPLRAVAGTLGAAIFLLTLDGFPGAYHLGGGLEDWRAISSGILKEAQPGDAILFYPQYSRTPFEYYRARVSPGAVWPREIAGGADAETKGFVLPSSSAGPWSPSVQPGRKIWVVFHHPNPLTIPERLVLRSRLASWRSKGWPLLRPQENPMVLVLLFAASSTDAVSPEQLPGLFPLSSGAQANSRPQAPAQQP